MFNISKIGFFLSVFSALVAGGPLGVVLFINPSITLEPWLKIAIIIIIVLISFFLSYFRELKGEQEHRKAESFKLLSAYLMPENIRQSMNTFLDGIVVDIPEGRANIMLIENRDGTDVLAIKYHVGMNGSADIDCSWEKREGCCGGAWANGETKFLDLSVYSKEEERNNALRNNLGIRAQNIACTKDVMCILSVPIFDARDSNKIIGVLNCDSKLAAEKSGLQNDEKAKSLLSLGKVISQILSIYSIVKEG